MFDWDESKRKQVLRDHKIDFEKVTDVFDDPLALYIEDFEHSSGSETRFNVIGTTAVYGLVFVAYVYTQDGDGIRFVTARRAENWMVKEYEKRRERL